MSLLGFSKKQPQRPSTEESMGATTSARSGDCSLISEGCRASGKFITAGDMRIEGSFHGTLEVGKQLIVASSGVIESESVVCRNAQISGTVNGPITVYEVLRICSGGVITGDIVVADLLVEQGGTFNGNCRRLSAPEIPSSSKAEIAQQVVIDAEPGRAKPKHEINPSTQDARQDTIAKKEEQPVIAAP